MRFGPIVLHSPTTFNSQSNRAVILFGEHHTRLWDLVVEGIKKVFPPEESEGSVGRVRMFQV